MEVAIAAKTCRQNMTETNKFDNVFACTVETTEKELELDMLSLARQKRPPARFSVPTEAYQPTDIREYFKVEYGEMI